MVSPTDLEILRRLRSDERNISNIARTLGLPVSTVHDKVRTHRQRGLIRRQVPLLDFGKLGFGSSAVIAMKAAPGRRDDLQKHLEQHPNVNTLFRVNFDHDFVAEVVFQDAGKMQEFLEDLESGFGVKQPRMFTVISEIGKERFLTNREGKHGI
jgi:DNA-binding Lrp family transcriptional regulator